MSDNAEYDVIITNDDGIDAPGILVLERALEKLIQSVIVAPAGPCSGCGHAVTTHQPFRVISRATQRIAVDGTPADCVRVGLLSVAPEARWVVSGINAGGNLGCDVYHSGTVAAAREAAIHGVGAIAFSQFIDKGRTLDWERAAHWAKRVFRELQNRPLPHATFWNVNFPHLEPGDPEPSLVECAVDPSPLPMDYRTDGETWTYCGKYQSRARRPGQDVDICFGGAISLSQISVASMPDPHSGSPDTPPGV
jgi:5'-nucleotidase